MTKTVTFTLTVQDNEDSVLIENEILDLIKHYIEYDKTLTVLNIVRDY